MNITVLTFPRKVEYIHQTLASLFLSGFNKKININVGCPNIEFVKKYSQYDNISIKSIPESHWNKIKNLPKYVRINWNLFLSLDSNTNNVIMQDDIMFVSNWFEKMHNLIKEIEMDGHKSYILGMPEWNVNSDPTRPASPAGRNYLKVDGFMPAICTYYPQPIVQFVKNVLMDLSFTKQIKVPLTWVQKKETIMIDPPDDILIGESCKQKKIPIFIPKEPLTFYLGKHVVCD